MLSFNILTFSLIISYSQSNIYLKEMNEYVDMALEILNDSSEHDSTGKFISHFNLNNRETIGFFFRSAFCHRMIWFLLQKSIIIVK